MPYRDLDPHARPPEKIKGLYKRYQKLKGDALFRDMALLDLQRDHATLVRVGQVSVDEQEEAFKTFSRGEQEASKTPCHPLPIYAHEAMPGNTFLAATHHPLEPLIPLSCMSNCLHLISRQDYA